LVKPTALVVALPLLAWATVAIFRSLRARRDWLELGRGLGAAAPLVAAAEGPAVLAYFSVPRFSAISSGFVYSAQAPLGERLLNALRGIARHIPLPATITQRIAPDSTMGCIQPHALCTGVMFLFHEDSAGNIGQAVLVAALLALGAIRFRRLPRRSQVALASVPAGWLLFHAAFIDNIWLTRLQLPLFAVAALALVSFGARPGRPPARAIALGPIGILLTAYAALAVALNESRPPSVSPRSVAFAESASAYYRWAPHGVEAAHAASLAALGRSGCRRLGMYIGGDSFDYPLAWRAMQAGIEVRHLLEPDDWPCVVYSDQGLPPPRPSGQAWQLLAPSVYAVTPAP
jgi:hypothetical protein